MATSAHTDWASFRALAKSDSPWNSRNALSRPIRELRPPASTKVVKLEFDELIKCIAWSLRAGASYLSHPTDQAAIHESNLFKTSDWPDDGGIRYSRSEVTMRPHIPEC